MVLDLLHGLVVVRNEQSDIASCIDSFRPASIPVTVIDTGSTDSTCAVAAEHGASVVQMPCGDLFDGDEASFRNTTLDYFVLLSQWVIILDADEQLPQSTALSLREEVAQVPASYSAISLLRQDHFYSRPLRFCQQTSLFTRILRPQECRYQRRINPVIVTKNPVFSSSLQFDHYPFSKGITPWVHRHNSYSSLESVEIHNANLQNVSLYTALFSNDQALRRLHLKSIYYRLPFRPLIKFFLLYILKLGFLDGKAGLTFCLLISFYELLILLKESELKLRAS